MSLRAPQKMGERLIRPGEHLISPYTGTIIDTYTSSSQKIWEVVYYYDEIDMDWKDELSAALGLMDVGEITLRMYRATRDDLPHINQVTEGNLVTALNRNVLTLDPSFLGGRTFRPGDWLNIGNHCLKILVVSGNDITIENLPEDFASINPSTLCSTVSYQIRAKKMSFDTEFMHIAPNKYAATPITFLEVIQ